MLFTSLVGGRGGFVRCALSWTWIYSDVLSVILVVCIFSCIVFAILIACLVCIVITDHIIINQR